MPANEIRMDDGFSTLITLSNIPAIKIYEKEVTPPGFQAGGPIDTTTMRNTEWRTMAPKQLKTLSAVSATVAFATDALEDIKAQIGVKQEVQIRFPDGSTYEFWGWLDEFTPGNFTEGEQPTASITIQPSNTDADGVETGPIYTAPSDSSES